MMKLADALQRDFDTAHADCGLTHKQIANAYDKSPTSSWPYELLRGNVPFTLPMVQMWVSLTGARNFMVWMGEQTDHFVAPIPHGDARSDTAHVLQEFSEYLQTTARAVADGVVTRDEIADIEREAHEACSAIMAEVEALRRQAMTARKTTLRAVK